MGRAAKPGQESPEAGGDFLARWSRRKTEARAGADRPDEHQSVTGPPPAAESDAAQQARGPEQELTDADMPAIETLNADSDYAPFMSPGVSDGLRQKALRILFNQPGCNITDGLNDYDEDYTRFTGLGTVVTHEMKRMLKRELEAETDSQQLAEAGVREAGSGKSDMPASDQPAQAPAPAAASGQPDVDTDHDASDKGQAGPGSTVS